MQRIMIVDDTLFMRVTLKNILVSAGYTSVFQAENGADAIDKFAILCPDLVLMDITMPQMDGIAATKAIKHDCPKACIVMCSGGGQKSVVIDAVRAGARDFIVKPFTSITVVETVRRLIGEPGDSHEATVAA